MADEENSPCRFGLPSGNERRKGNIAAFPTAQWQLLKARQSRRARPDAAADRDAWVTVERRLGDREFREQQK